VTIKKNEDEFPNAAGYANVRRWGNSVLLAICDSELLGKVLRDEKIVFDVREEFYKGMKMSVDEAVDLIAQSTIVNMVGHHVIREALKRRLIHQEAILRISGIPHAQIVKM